MVFTGSFVGVPLTIIQSLNVHSATGMWPSVGDAVGLTGLNFVLAHSIYDGDRLRGYSGPDAPFYRRSTELATLASTAYLWQNDVTRTLSPLVPFLHYFYTSTKPAFAPIKPLFVGVTWTLATCAVPSGLLDVPLDAQVQWITCLQLCGWSNLADVEDIAEDRAMNIRTPAVLLGENKSFWLTCALLYASAATRFFEPSATVVEHAYDLFNLLVLQLYWAGRPFRPD